MTVFILLVVNEGVNDLYNPITQIPSGTSTLNIIKNIQFIKKTHCHVKALLLVWSFVYRS